MTISPITSSISIEAVNGAQAGLKIPLRDGLIIGRAGVDLNIQDSKVSSRHATLELRPDGFWWLIDLKSANGLKVNGKKLRKLRLEPGVSVLIGRIEFKVTAVRLKAENEVPQVDSGAVESETLAFAADVIEKPKHSVPLPAAVEPAPRSWKDLVLSLVENALSSSTTVKREIEAFDPVLKLDFVRGAQTGTQWIVGYGPREVGGGSIDLRLEDPGLPPLCFRLLPHKDGTQIKVQERAKNKLKVNGKKVETAALADGDLIELGPTQIKISFEKSQPK
jgi:pSer/pThr/pTyr-binding forkhead associated (FHA) protein